MTHLNHNEAERIARKIRLMMQRSGLSQREIQSRTGKSLDFLSLAERDSRLLTEDVLRDCARGLDRHESRQRYPYQTDPYESMTMKDLVAFFDAYPTEGESPKQLPMLGDDDDAKSSRA